MKTAKEVKRYVVSISNYIVLYEGTDLKKANKIKKTRPGSKIKVIQEG